MNEIVKAAAVMTALEYLNNPSHGDWYYFPCTIAYSAGVHGAKRRLMIAKVDRHSVIDAIKTGKAIDSGWLKISDNVLKVRKLSETALRKALGDRFVKIPLRESFSTYSDLPYDPTPCAGPRARTFEKVVCKAINAKWTGALRNVQIDGVEKFIDDAGNVVKITHEVKGLGGRITAYCPSAIDRDIKE